jgi:hypothetical protein
MTATVSFLGDNQLWEHDGVEKAEFSYMERKDGSVAVSWRGRIVKVITGTRARRFLDRIPELSASAAQLEMARATGNFKRGNEDPLRERRDRSPEMR